VVDLICGRKFELNRSVFKGVLAPTHRGFGILTTLSRSWLQIVVDKKKFKRG
jgi:hypothetical protein